MSSEKRIIITHCVDPHNFYFKYVDDCVNKEYSNFDYEIQCYGNGSYDRQLSIHHPDKNELIIFFDVISNKWLRGRVTKVKDDEITLWCIDSGILRKVERQFIQSLPENLKKDFNLVHLGGVSVLPAESTLNFETMNVQMQVTHSWDKEMINNFKVIIDSAKRICFIEDMELEQHKFGTLTIETWKDKVVVVDDILLQMNKTISCGGSAGMTTYMSEKRMQEDFQQSLEKATNLSHAINSRRTSIASGKCENETITNPFKSETFSDGSCHANWIQPKETSNISKPSKPEETSSECDKSKKRSGASGKSDGIELHLEPVMSKGIASTSEKPKTEVEEKPFKPKKTSETSGKSGRTEPDLVSVKPKGTTSTSNHFEKDLGESLKPTKPSSAPVKCDWEPVKPDGAANKCNKSKIETANDSGKSVATESVKPKIMADTQDENPFKPKKFSVASGKLDGIELHLEPVKRKENASTSDKSKMEIEKNPIEPKKRPVAFGKSDGIELQVEPVKSKENASTSDKSKTEVKENPFKPKKTSGASSKSGRVEPDLISVKPEGTKSTSNHFEKELEELKPTTPSSASLKCDWEPVTTDGATNKCNQSKIEAANASGKSAATESVKPKIMADTLDENPFKQKKLSVASVKFDGIKLHREPVQPDGKTIKSDKSEMKMEENPFKPKKMSVASGKFDGIELHLEPVTSKENASTSDKSKMEIEKNRFKSKKSDGIKLPLETVKPGQTTISNKSKMDENLINCNPNKPSGEPNKLNCIEPKKTLGHSVKSDTNLMHSKAKSSHQSEKPDHSSLQNGFDLIESIDKSGIDSVESSARNGIDMLSSLDGSFDTVDTVSMAVSTIRTFLSDTKAHPNREKPQPVHIDYDCHLKTLKFGSGEKLRQPLQSSLDWINQQRFQVADDNESCYSSIINLMDD